MIKRIKQVSDITFFLQEVKDINYDFYITENKERRFLTDSLIAQKVIKKYQVFGEYNSDLQGLFIIIEEKGFRRYLKLLAKNNKIANDLLKYINWNFSDKDLFIKIKKENSVLEALKANYYQIIGDRGKETLLVHNKREIKKIIPKDLGDDNGRCNIKDTRFNRRQR